MVLRGNTWTQVCTNLNRLYWKWLLEDALLRVVWAWHVVVQSHLKQEFPWFSWQVFDPLNDSVWVYASRNWILWVDVYLWKDKKKQWPDHWDCFTNRSEDWSGFFKFFFGVHFSGCLPVRWWRCNLFLGPLESLLQGPSASSGRALYHL